MTQNHNANPVNIRLSQKCDAEIYSKLSQKSGFDCRKEIASGLDLFFVELNTAMQVSK